MCVVGGGAAECGCACVLQASVPGSVWPVCGVQMCLCVPAPGCDPMQRSECWGIVSIPKTKGVGQSLPKGQSAMVTFYRETCLKILLNIL